MLRLENSYSPELIMLWKPKWKKEALLTLKGANKFINYKKDLITASDIENIRTRQQELKDAIKSKDSKETKKKCCLLYTSPSPRDRG